MKNIKKKYIKKNTKKNTKKKYNLKYKNVSYNIYKKTQTQKLIKFTNQKPPKEPMSIWFIKPADSFNESNLVGNGRLGAMDFGGVMRTDFILNETSLWSGGYFDPNNYDSYKSLPKLQNLFLSDDIDSAKILFKEKFKLPDGIKFNTDNFGCYQIMANWKIDMNMNLDEDILTSPSGDDSGYLDHNIINTLNYNKDSTDTDHNENIKWLVKTSEKNCIWQLKCAYPKSIIGYTFISADNNPEFDPKEWYLSASRDGDKWFNIDYKNIKKLFTKRIEDKTFTIRKSELFTYYRFTFMVNNFFQIKTIKLNFENIHNEYSYIRDLNLMTGVSTTSFTIKDITYTRELLASKPDDIIALRIRTNKPLSISFSTALSRKENSEQKSDNIFQWIEGQLPFNIFIKNEKTNEKTNEGMKFQAMLGMKVDGGKCTCDKNGFTVIDANEVLLIVSGGTNYKSNLKVIRTNLENSLKKSFEEIRDDSIKDHNQFMQRCQLFLPNSINSNLPTSERIKLINYKPDPSLESLYFQYGRYLMVSSSRPDSILPSNLQGIWAEELNPQWNSSFVNNINLQMNYWLSEITNLSDCHMPLFHFIKGLAKEGKKTAKAMYNAPGWMCFHHSNPWFYTGLDHLENASSVCGAWLCQHIWMHYEFTKDIKFLKEYYTIMKDACLFFEYILVEDPNTKLLVTIPSTSPENRYFYINKDGIKKSATLCIGSSFDMQIIRNLFINTIKATEILKLNPNIINRFRKIYEKCTPIQIGKNGGILEWQKDFKEYDVSHRHLSHLWGLYPGTEIASNNELRKAATISLIKRGHKNIGWNLALRSLYWARLNNGKNSENLLKTLITKGSPNMLSQHPPFQIDGNFGGTAAIAEMLLQSYEEKDGSYILHLLPALPPIWQSGKINGLCARGRFTVDIEWENFTIKKYNIFSSINYNSIFIKINDKIHKIKLFLENNLYVSR